MEQRKRALTNAAKRQMLRATAQPEAASNEMQAGTRKTECGPTPQIGNAPDHGAFSRRRLRSSVTMTSPASRFWLTEVHV